jgi:hypothetical protein
LAALTPDPAFAFFTPFGRRSSGQIFKQLDPQRVLLALSVYRVFPLTKKVPRGVCMVETTRVFDC